MVVVEADVVLARPDHLDRFAKLLREHGRFGGVVRLGLAPEAATQQRRVQGQLLWLDADRRRKVKHDVAAFDQFGQQRLVVDRVDEVLEAFPTFQKGDVVDRPRRQVVEHENVVALREQGLAKMGSDKAGAAGNCYPFHFLPMP